MPVICVTNQKGGVGKTTTSAALAHALKELGQSVLLLDWDSQASLTITMGIDPSRLELTGYSALAAAIRNNSAPALRDVIIATAYPGIDIIPSNIELSQAELDLVGALTRELLLRDMLESVRHSYDYVIIDCLPSLGLLTINALSAADQVLIPLQADFLAMKGLALLLSTIVRVRDRLNPGLEIAGILFTMTSARTLHCREVMTVTRKAFGNRIRVFDTQVPSSVRFKEAPAAGGSILTYASNSEGARAYRLLAREVMK